MRRCIWIAVAFLSLATAAWADLPKEAADEVARYNAYRKVVAATAGMVRDPAARRLAAKHGLRILDLTWEDTGRYKGSAVGPNISDMTIQVQQADPRTERFRLTCMPVIRYPNFTDKTGDVPIDRFFLLVGNQKGRRLHKVTLQELLSNLRKYLSKPASWRGPRKSLLAERDKHVLVSAQACFLPVPRRGIAQFNPVLFNYQSYRGDPAVLTILATREGTSVTVIDNVRDAFQAGRTWGQRLFFNQNGERASLTGQRLSEFLSGRKPPKTGPDGRPVGVEAGESAGLNMVLLIQVPLKQKRPMYRSMPMPMAAPGAMPEGVQKRGSDVEAAVIGHGKVEGPFTEIDNLPIERDPRFPVRVTVQFYKATSNGVVSRKDMAEIARQIRRVYDEADYVGSLVVEGETGRPAEHEGPKVEPHDWWDRFWRRYWRNTGEDPVKVWARLRKHYGADWAPRSEAELEAAIRRMKEE
jgi:hypothetical protein